MKDFYKATSYKDGAPSASVCLSTNIVSHDKLGMVTLRSGELNAHVHLTLDQMAEFANILNDAIDWWNTMPARKAAEEEQAQRHADDLADDIVAQAPRKPLPNFMTNGSAL
jgi:hypothetical protein